MKQHISEIFTKRRNIVLLAVLCTFLWGSGYPGVKIGMELFSISGDAPFSKILFAGCRFFLAGLAIIAFLTYRNKKIPMPTKQNLGDILLLGFIYTSMNFFFFYIGLSHTTGVKGAILNALGTFIAVILAHFIYQNDKMNIQKSLGCIIGFAGVVLINVGGGSTMDGGFTFTGEGFMILTAVTFSVGSLLSKRVAGKGEPMMVTGWQLASGGAVLIVVGMLGGGQIAPESWQGIFLFFYLVLLSSVAFVVWTLLLKYNPVGKVAVFNFLTPIFGTVLSALLLHESILELKNITALLMVCIGIGIVNYQKRTT